MATVQSPSPPIPPCGSEVGTPSRARIEGHVDGTSDGMHGEASFEEVCVDLSAGAWVHALTQKASSFTLTGQPSGHRLSVRQRAIGTTGPGLGASR